MTKEIKSNIKAIILGLALALGVGYVGATGTFTSPTCAPPGCNTDAPVNVGTVAQGKAGGLAVGTTDISLLGIANLAFKVNGTLLSNGAAFNGPIAIADGSQSAGRVLVSSDTGLATWKDPASLSTSCAASGSYSLGSLTGNSGNNQIYLKLITILEPGTYTITGQGQSNNAGGGGTDSVFLSSTYYPDGTRDTNSPQPYPTEVSPYVGTTQTSTSDQVTYSTGSPIVYAVKRFGNSTPTNWTIPANTTVTLAAQKYMYIVLGQASENGYVYTTGTKTNCSGVTGGGGYSWVDVLTSAQKNSASFPNDQYNYQVAGVRAPSQICADAGYTYATGACRGSGVSTPFNYEGSTLYNTAAGTPSIACMYGNAPFTHADKNTQLLCAR